VDRRLQMTAIVMESLVEIAERLRIPVLHGIRVDATITKASRARQFLVDYDPGSRSRGRLPDCRPGARKSAPGTDG